MLGARVQSRTSGIVRLTRDEHRSVERLKTRRNDSHAILTSPLAISFLLVGASFFLARSSPSRTPEDDWRIASQRLQSISNVDQLEREKAI
jgi:hypothetical protein